MTAADIVATYLIETPHPLEHAAEVIAGEQSSGTFVAVPGETEELKARHRARVIGIDALETVPAASLPGSKAPRGGGAARYQRGLVRIAFPFDNVGANLPTLAATVAGNLFELAEVSGLKLLDLDVPAALAARCPGPQFGVKGTRRLAGVAEGPLIGTIVKPSVGLAPEQTGRLVRTLAEAGIDFVKDDELMANPPHAPLEARVASVMRAIDESADRTGKKTMFAFNISDDLDAMLRHHDAVLAAGGTCVMVSINHVGLSAVTCLRRRAQLPIHAHRNGWGLFTRHPALGMAFTPYQKIWRLAGVDQLHVNGLGNKFWEPDDSVVQSIRACLAPTFDDPRVMPVVSSGQWGGQAPETYRQTGTTDLMYLAGGGIMAHPGGPAAGVRALRQAWEAAVRGVSLDEYAAAHVELRQALERFGKT